MRKAAGHFPVAGFPLYRGKPWILPFTFQPRKYLAIAQKLGGKPGILVENLEKKQQISNCFVSRFTFQDVIYKKNLLHLRHIYIINTNTVIWSQIDLGFHCFSLEITWKIHGISHHQRSGNPVLVLDTSCLTNFHLKSYDSVWRVLFPLCLIRYGLTWW